MFGKILKKKLDAKLKKNYYRIRTKHGIVDVT